MTNTFPPALPPPPPEPVRPNPQSTVQVAGRVAEDVVLGLKQQPAMLSLIVLNIIGVGAAAWFLNDLNEHTRHIYESTLKHCFEIQRQQMRQQSGGQQWGLQGNSSPVQLPPYPWPKEKVDGPKRMEDLN